jgi:hypothetical protein
MALGFKSTVTAGRSAERIGLATVLLDISQPDLPPTLGGHLEACGADFLRQLH